MPSDKARAVHAAQKERRRQIERERSEVRTQQHRERLRAELCGKSVVHACGVLDAAQYGPIHVHHRDQGPFPPIFLDAILRPRRVLLTADRGVVCGIEFGWPSGQG